MPSIPPDRYAGDVLAGFSSRPAAPDLVDAEPGLVVEDIASGWCGAVVGCTAAEVTLADRFDRERVFPVASCRFLLEGRPVRLQRPAAAARDHAPRRTASGSVAAPAAPARTARASRIWVEGVHDAALVQRVWGDDLRVEGVVVEPLGGIDDLVAAVRDFDPSAQRRVGVLVDHLVPGSKESRIVAGVRSPHVLVTGHPYVDIWQAVRPVALGIAGWPQVPRGVPWKDGICAALGVSDPQEMWRRVLGSVRTYADLETPLLGAVERLIDFVTEQPRGKVT